MKRTVLTFLLTAGAALALAIGSSLLTAPADALGGCSACIGPVHTVTGHGAGNNCSQALANAQADAAALTWAGAPACTPCQISDGPQACSVPSCYPGACPPNAYHASWALNYKCKTCSPDRPPLPGN
jgi:hypothetical protein